MTATLDAPPSERRDDLAPAPDDPRKPESPGEITGRSWRYVLRKTWREFGDDQCTDQAAALTYYSVLAVFPAMLALVSLLGVVGQAQPAIDTVLDVLRPLVSPTTLEAVEPILDDMAATQTAGFTLVVGLLGALWSASGYVGGFARAMNRIYEIEEGRPFWKLRPLMMAITLAAVTLSALVLVMLVASGDVADSVGQALGLGETTVLIWKVAKWPVLGLVVMLVVAMLYYATPNVQQPKFRWISVGAAVAIAIWVLASLAFAFYVANFSSYDKTYGSLAGVVVALLWLWITNLALLLGAELDAELERGRQLQAGIAAEEELQLPARDTRNIEKAHEREAEDVALGRRIRLEAAADGATPDVPEPVEGAASDPVVRAALDGSDTPHLEDAPAPSATTDDHASRLPVLAAGAAGFALGATVGRLTTKETS